MTQLHLDLKICILREVCIQGRFVNKLPVFDLRWLETKLYPVIFTSSAVQSVSQVSANNQTYERINEWIQEELEDILWR